ncbi:hypothetical protein KF913_08875 [Candidatus Obscuribacterales bacterium]|nr:hypothetical protein [Candidatus Obscuribacterales bacterium]
MKRFVVCSLLIMLGMGFSPLAASAQLLTSPSNEPEVTEPRKEEPEVKKEETKSDSSSNSKDEKKAKKAKESSDKAAKKAAAAAKKADAAAKKAAEEAKENSDASADASSSAKPSKAGRPNDRMQTPDAEDIKLLEQRLEKKAAKKSKKDENDSSNKADNSTDKKADDKPTDGKDTKKAGDLDGITGTESGDKPAKAGKVPFGKRMASFTCGAVLGYPVAMAKRSVYQTKNGTRDFVGETRNPFLLIPAVVVSAPYGFVGGFFEGAQYSVMNSWKASGEEPFSKETFSLDDD